MSSNNLPEKNSDHDLDIKDSQDPQESQKHGHDSGRTLKPRLLLRGEITYEEAQEQDANILHQLGYRDKQFRFFTHLYRHRKSIKDIVIRHLGLSTADTCNVVDVDEWIHGSFNVCIRVDVETTGQQVMVRFPLPYRIGEYSCPGNADEKVRCEVGTYAWLQENCPSVPIPHLYGYGFTDGKEFTYLEHHPFFSRTFQHLRRWILRVSCYPVPSLYAQNHSQGCTPLDAPYMVIEYIDSSRGRMLSETWHQSRMDPDLRKNFFHGLSKTMLTLMRLPLPNIGSFILDDNGILRLNNRPLTLEIQQLENEDIPVDIPRDSTHLRVESYVHDILALHESRLRHQPNAINNIEDGFYQTSALMVMRSIWPCFFRRDLFRGPFFLSLTDLNQSNIFVDKDWNIKCLIDLEWACSHPLEMIHPPYWLSNQAIDLISLDQFEKLHTEFLDAFAEEEISMELPFPIYPILQKGLQSGAFWCSLALSSPTALFKIFYDYLQPRFSKTHDDPTFWRITIPYWGFNTFSFIEQKVEEKKAYDRALQEEFRS